MASESSNRKSHRGLIKPGEVRNPTGRRGAKSTKTVEREQWRSSKFETVMGVFDDMLKGKDVPEPKRAAAFELRKAVLPDLRPIDGDTGSSTDVVVVVREQADHDALAGALTAVKP